MRLFYKIPFIVLLCISNLSAHGDLDIRIQAITQEINTYPDSAVLYYQRGKLRFQHEEYDLSIKDIKTSIQHNYYDELQNIYLAKSYYKLQKYDEALSQLAIFLKDDPNHVVGVNLKGRILFAQNQFETSALCFEKVIAHSIKSLPENYIEAAQAWEKSNHPEKYHNTVSILTQGLENLGRIVTLQDRLIETHLLYDNPKEAIRIQLSIIDTSKRKETAYVKLAEIYISTGNDIESQLALQNARLHWNKLPRRIQKNSAMVSLKNKIENLINNFNN